MKVRFLWAMAGLGLFFSWTVFAFAPEPAEPAENKVLPEIERKITVVAKPTIRVMTLNVAHGAKNRFGIAPFLRGADTIRERLTKNATVFLRENPDIVALQEADAPSWWSGRFHHVQFLAEKSLYPFYALGIHVKDKSKAYGTGFLSRLPLRDVASHRFRESGMFKKGFVIGSFAWPTKKSKLVDVISVHLHPSNKSIQHTQVRQIAHTVRQRKRSVVIMGDFNCTWMEDRSALHELTHSLGLRAYEPFATNLHTHRAVSKRRIDWIFVSHDLAFTSYRVVREGVVSDHDAVVADLELAPSATRPSSRPAPPVLAPTSIPWLPPVKSAPSSSPATAPVR